MNPPVVTAQLRAMLDEGPQPIDALTAALGITRRKLHKLIHRHGMQIIRADTTPGCGRRAQPVYQWGWIRRRARLTDPSPTA